VKAEISYQVRAATRRSRSQIPLGHAAKAERIKIGNDYHGKPVGNPVVAAKALCGTDVSRGGEYGAPVNCRRCIAKLRQMVASAPPTGASQQAVAAQLALDAVYAAGAYPGVAEVAR
jgi:hypothetical protein